MAFDKAPVRPGVRLFDMGGRPMRGWIPVPPSVLADDAALTDRIDEGRTYAAGLPPE